MIDPFLDKNPLAPIKSKDLKNIELILITHAHSDHLGDAVEIAKRNNATIVAIYELATYLNRTYGVKTFGMNIGGYYNFNDVKVWMFNAIHSSSIIEKEEIIYAGNPVSYVLEIENKKVFHAGDTGLFKDMELIPKIVGNIDVAILPIGGIFTMDINQARIALEMLKPKIFIPMHYNTFDLIKIDKKELEKVKEAKTIILSPGEEFEL